MSDSFPPEVEITVSPQDFTLTDEAITALARLLVSSEMPGQADANTRPGDRNLYESG